MSELRVTIAHHGGAHHGPNGGVDVLVVHDEEYPLRDTSAESIARMFADPSHGDSCCAYVVDSNSIQKCGRDDELMYHAPPNKHTLGAERDGYASWHEKDWLQPDAQLTTCNVAALFAELAQRHTIPISWLSVQDLIDGRRGITSHANRSRAFGLSTHTDPGPNFPVDTFVDLVGKAWRETFRHHPDADVLGVGRWLYDEAGGKPAPAPKPSPKSGAPKAHLKVDGVRGESTINALKAALNYHLDGADLHMGGREDGLTIKHEQKYLHVPIDGERGPRTISAEQKHTGAPVDGIDGPDTTRHLQQALNDGRY